MKIVFPYSVHSTANLPAWNPKDENVTFMSFLCLFTEIINPEVFSQNYMTNVKVDEVRQELSTSHFGRNQQNWNLSFCKFLLKYEPRIKDKKLHDKEKHLEKFLLFLQSERTFT